MTNNLKKSLLLYDKVFPLFNHIKGKFNSIKFLHNEHITKQKQATTVIINSIDKTSKIKPYDQIPAKKGFLPSSLELIIGGGPGYLHKHCDKLHKELGPIYKEYLGQIDLVFLADTKLIQIVIANEGEYPHHNVPEAWNFYNQVNGVERGLFFQIGKPWAKLRKVFSKIMLADSNITKFSNDILKINNNLFELWNKKATSIGKNEKIIIIDDVKSELCKWSIETTGFILFGNRMGCIPEGTNRSVDSRADELVRSVATMFDETSKFQILPVNLAYKFKLKTWKQFESATDTMLSLANEYTRENLMKAKTSTTNNGLIKDLLESNELTDEELSRSLIDLIIAASDTTSNSLQWMLYLIAKHPNVQTKILEETKPLLGKNLTIVAEDLKDNAPYLRAFLKEASRLYPTAPFLARTLDKDISLAGYSIPAKKPIVFSLFTTSRMEKYFEKPLEFKPERWLRNANSTNHYKATNCPRKTPYASLPFGIGARMCIGRRAAELEMALFIASFVNKFESSLYDNKEIDIKLKMILCPSRPIKLKLRARIPQM